ncbi:hypothetical protein Tco_1259122 [Tanacetum coccineum]
MALPPREQRYKFLRYEGLEYTNADIADFEARLARIHRTKVHRVLVFDFGGLLDLIAEGLAARMLIEHQDDQGVSVFTSRAWRRLFDIIGPLVPELILEFFNTHMSWREFILTLGLPTNVEMQTAGSGTYWARSAKQIPNKGDLRDYWIGISSARDFLGTSPLYTMIQDPILRLCHRLIACSTARRSQAPELFSTRKKSVAHIFRGQFVARLAEHSGLLTAEILRGLTVIAPELPIINMIELVRLQICTHFDDTWVWVSMGLERQPDVVADAPADAEDTPIVNEDDQAILAPIHAP